MVQLANTSLGDSFIFETPIMGEMLVYGLEVPCVYRLCGPNVYVDTMKELVKSLLGHYSLCNSDFAQ